MKQWITWSKSIVADWMRHLIKELPSFVQDVVKGVSTGLAVTMPFLAIWLSFNRPGTFTFAYMKESSLLVLWLLAVVHVWPIKALKAGKDGVHFEFHDRASGIPPNKATGT